MGRGFVWFNGVLLGRYWEVGPQVTLYAPAPLWLAGANEVVVLELDHPGTQLELRADPTWVAPPPEVQHPPKADKRVIAPQCPKRGSATFQ
ncbi:hypothetical protein [Intrasporangium calvum]|uniref:hypothetical protein n=1 Tax=Intrasporangium calvum TaxID=53358 RepID=UPI000DF64359|nr:hypothetical protein [Intrasporangium calvum]AXG14309.1 hypothetical protein DN585_13640 [Intrasporangium calvum]